MKFLCSLPVVEDCHGNIFFLQRINLFSVNNVHRAKGEDILFIYKKLYRRHPSLDSQQL